MIKKFNIIIDNNVSIYRVNAESLSECRVSFYINSKLSKTEKWKNGNYKKRQTGHYLFWAHVLCLIPNLRARYFDKR